MSATFLVGDVARTFVHFYRKPDVGKQVLADPTAITCVVKTPQNVETTFTFGVDAELVRISSGFYKLEQPCTIAGQWEATWQGIGAVAAVDRVIWLVKP